MKDKRVKIAVYVQEIWSDYNKALIKGIFDFCNEKKVDVMFSQIRLPIFEEDTYGLQYWSSLRLAETEDVDAIIMCSPTFCSRLPVTDFEVLVRRVSSKKIVSVSIPFSGKDACNTRVSCEESYLNAVEHMVKEHNAKRFAFMSADLENSVEARERYDAFKKALNVLNLTIEDSHVFHGDFMFDSAVRALSQRYSKKEEVDFDTLFASNDMMAYGSVSYLQKLGVKVPEEVRVIGYDDIKQPSASDIALSTINPQIELQGRTAAELALNYALGIENPRETKIQTQTVFRESCGCSYDRDNPKNKIMIDERVEALNRNDWALNRVHNMLDNTQSDETLDVVFAKMYDLMGFNGIKFSAVCLYDDPVYVEAGEVPEIPSNVNLVFCVDESQGIKMVGSKISYNIRKRFFPEEINPRESGTYLVHPIFYGDYSYGFVYFSVESVTIPLYSIFIKILSNQIAQAYKYTRSLEEKEALEKKNIALNIESYTDEMTGIINRRGLLKFGKESIDLSIQLEKNGTVLFCDMDHLKKINDTFGHEWGDIAIKAQCEILQKTFRTNDMISRLGGDEFVIIAPGLQADKIPHVRERMDRISEEVKIEKNLPFDVKISIGGVDYSEKNSDLERLIMLADKEQYEEKKRHHVERQ